MKKVYLQLPNDITIAFFHTKLNPNITLAYWLFFYSSSRTKTITFDVSNGWTHENQRQRLQKQGSKTDDVAIYYYRPTPIGWWIPKLTLGQN
jgi:hypothetical protein